jgi:isoleucyl-tRNA synthetase
VKAKMPVRQALGLLTVRLKDSGEASRISAKTDLLGVLRDELNVERVAMQGGLSGEESFAVELDTTITPELKKKGMARELSRHLMNLRKAMGLTPSDMIAFELSTEDHGLRDTLESLADAIAKDVRASSHGVGDTGVAAESETTVEMDGHSVVIRIRRA